MPWRHTGVDSSFCSLRKQLRQNGRAAGPLLPHSVEHLQLAVSQLFRLRSLVDYGGQRKACQQTCAKTSPKAGQRRGRALSTAGVS